MPSRARGVAAAVLLVWSFFLASAASSFPALAAPFFTFTTAGVTGRFGPPYAQLTAAYGYGAGKCVVGPPKEIRRVFRADFRAATSRGSTNNAWWNNASLFSVVGGIQYVTIKETGYYQLEVAGASLPFFDPPSASPSTGVTPLGAVVKTDAQLTAGQVLAILVGQAGNGFGGGGGSFVALVPSAGSLASSKLLVAAGGAGGAGTYGGFNSNVNASAPGVTPLPRAPSQIYGQPQHFFSFGLPGENFGSAPGAGGQSFGSGGGAAPATNGACGGGGSATSGGSFAGAAAGACGGGAAFADGGVGGLGGLGGGDGGFGGGGGGGGASGCTLGAGGGGDGYVGGGGGGVTSTDGSGTTDGVGAGGGGGGSFVSPNFIFSSLNTAGPGGYVTLTRVAQPAFTTFTFQTLLGDKINRGGSVGPLSSALTNYNTTSFPAPPANVQCCACVFSRHCLTPLLRSCSLVDVS